MNSSSCCSSPQTIRNRLARRSRTSTRTRARRLAARVMAMAIGKLPDAAADEGDEGGESIFAEINITPLTDVFLVMVIIFMVSALAVQVEARHEKKKIAEQKDGTEQKERLGIKVNLPQGQAQEIDPTKASLVLVVPLTGDVDVGGKRIPDGELDNLFRAAFARDK